MAIFDRAAMQSSITQPNPNIPALRGTVVGNKPVVSQTQSFIDNLKAGLNDPSYIDTAGTDANAALQMGLDQATSTLDPNIQRSEQLSGVLQNLLMGNADISSIPGYDSMVSARGAAIDDLGTGMAGTGKFFSGSTAEAAADIGGSMENQLIQQRIQNLMMGAQPGQQMGSQLAGMQMGAGTAGAQIPLNLAQMQMQKDIAAQQAKAAADANKAGFFGDLLGAAGTIGGFMMGGPAGAAAGGAAAGAAGGV